MLHALLCSCVTVKAAQLFLVAWPLSTEASSASNQMLPKSDEIQEPPVGPVRWEKFRWASVRFPILRRRSGTKIEKEAGNHK